MGIVASQVMSEVYVGSTGEYVPFEQDRVTLFAHTTFDVGVGSTDDHVMLTARQLVMLLSHIRFDVDVGSELR